MQHALLGLQMQVHGLQGAGASISHPGQGAHCEGILQMCAGGVAMGAPAVHTAARAVTCCCRLCLMNG
jgi:hypothetical protein